MKNDDVLSIRLNAEDNVVVAMQELAAGRQIHAENIVTRVPIPAGHKVAAGTIQKGDYVRKYGQIIGVASVDIQAGDHVHTHNLNIAEFSRDYSVASDARPTNFLPQEEQATFDGFIREEGQIATRNYIGVLPSVSCSASVCRYIADAFTDDILAEYPNVDGVVGITQTSGCGGPAYGEGFNIL
ncbi:MAG: UxaA family hydrolase, partial [Desulfobacterales bacterium]